ncbi:MAG: hypothetical protein A2Z34_09390 [Planctomycetes bacterium RBG_16_59_8]|nr:MAG: hypothetical protein A2Z34_09390 [Planctomycetes bacterium RBG_16_59_8]
MPTSVDQSLENPYRTTRNNPGKPISNRNLLAESYQCVKKCQGVFVGQKHRNRIDGITVEFTDWWFNVRKSNTEPLLRLNLEARTPELREEKKRLLSSLLGMPTA